MAVSPLKVALAFTEEQAQTGAASYAQFCAACHGADLRTLPTAPLVGDEFIAKWRTRSTNDLLAQLRTTMPPESPGSLGEDAYLALMAYVLQRNGNAASDQQLLAASGESIAAGAGGGAAGGAAPARPAGLLVKGTVDDFAPVTDAALRAPAPGDWPMIRRDYSASSFSPLDEITAGNVGQLQLAWIWPMRDGGTNQPAPIVYRGTIYLNNTDGVVQALDARDGSLIWEHRI
jgi:alcohol dehydrogenase (cytochrome c)